MNPSLDIFFPLHDSDAVRGKYYAATESVPVEYCGEAAIPEAFLHKETVRIFIPGEWVSIHQTELPRGARKQAETLLPALLEEDVGESIEHLHFALLDLESEQATVAVIAQQKMQQITAWMQAANIASCTVLPDWMALACGTLLIRDGRCLFRATSWLGWSCPLALASVFLAAQLQHYPQPLRVFYDDELPPALAALLTENGATLSSQYETEPRADSVGESLLWGRWKPRTDYRQQWQRWRKIILTVAAGFVLLSVERCMALWSLHSQVQQTQLRVENTFQQLFPTQKRIVNLRAQINTALRNSSQQPLDDEVMMLLPLVASTLAPLQQHADIISLKIDQPQQSLFLQLRVPAYDYFPLLHDAFSHAFQVKQNDVQNKDNAVILGFTLGKKHDNET